MSKKTKRIQNKDDYEKSSFKDIMEDVEDTKNKALESVPKVRKNKFQVMRKHQRRYCMVMMTTMCRKTRRGNWRSSNRDSD
jgi:hypothetical protein